MNDIIIRKLNIACNNGGLDYDKDQLIQVTGYLCKTVHS